MAAVSPQITPVTTSGSTISSPPLKGIKKVLTGRRRSSEVQSETSSLHGIPRASVTSVSEVSPTRKSPDSSPSRDGSSKSGSSGMRKLLPGHNKRRRRKIREEELRVAEEETSRGRSTLLSTESLPDLHNRSTTSLTHDGGSSLLTDDSEPDTAPPLVSRDSHIGYLTTSSPLITKATSDGENEIDAPLAGIPSIVTPPEQGNVSPNSFPISDSTPVLPMPGLVDKADTLRPESLDRGRRGSISKSLRGKSPARRFKDVFSSSKSQKSPKTSPERKVFDDFGGGVSSLLGKGGSISDRRLSKIPDKPGPDPVDTTAEMREQGRNTAGPPQLHTEDQPRTPPGSALTTPVTTVTPPTPTGHQIPDGSGSPRRHTEFQTSNYEAPGIVVSPSGNMISHRRTRSSSSATQVPSKLSSSTLPPLTPTIEEIRTPSGQDPQKIPGIRNFTPGGGFFSSWVSAAQTAASTLTNTLNTQNRSRSGTNKSESSNEGKASEDTVRELPVEFTEEEQTPKKQLAVETLGAGDLSFSHLGLEGSGDERSPQALRPELEELRKNSTLRRDEAAAKIEDMLAKRAVSAAYSKSNDHTPVAEIPDPIDKIRHTQTGMSMASTLGEHTPPNGSIFEGETGSIKRSTSMRSRMHKRRSRGSSIATGASAIGALIGGSTATLANPANGPRLTGFAVAPKQRNRTFHQSFRSVPEDDFLIEDYSCALQKEILLAGRIYISEGHICFSSNILGWVTTLVISFEEVVSIERETTAMVFPNAIAIQTLHARHTFRSLLSREATFDLLIGIWKVSHPASFKKSVNGKQWMEQEAAKMQQLDGKITEADEDPTGEEDSDEDSGSGGSYEDDSEGAPSFVGSAISMAGSEMVGDSKSLTRKPSAPNGTLTAHTSAIAPGSSAELTIAAATGIMTPEAQVDFPGPITHSPTDCTDSSTHYERIVKDEIIPAPLGKVYSLLYGPASGVFVKKYLLEECKVMELQFEEDKRGLNNEIKSRQYTYIKPLGGSIGPKQTKCITTENLDVFDLETAVSVTCTTQTPDVPNGSSFSVKTRYCLSWAPNNATRLQMTCGIEWTAKSWLKGPIEKGANDGQQSYGDGLVKVLRSAVESRKARERGATAASKGSKGRKTKRRRGEKGLESEEKAAAPRVESWGVFEPVRGIVEPVTTLLGPGPSRVLLFLLVGVPLLWWLMTPRARSAGAGVGFVGFDSSSARVAAYEEMWRREEGALWEWLEERAGVVGGLRPSTMGQGRDGNAKQANEAEKARKKVLGGKDVQARLREEKMSEREMEEQIRLTRERLDVLQGVVARKRAVREGGAV